MEQEQLLKHWMKTYGDAILRMCYIYLKDYQLAEDAVQETFLKAIKAYPSFQNKSSEKTWLIRIAINCCKNISRIRWFRTKSIDQQQLANLPAAANIEEDFLKKDTVSGAIAALAPADKEMILLYYYQDFTIKEIAAIIKKSENTTSQRLSRAKKRFKKILLEVNQDE